jgi:low affinity Fe/Cu permease
MERHRTQLWLSRLLRGVGDVTSRSSVAAFMALATLVAVSALAASDFPPKATEVFTVTTASVVLVMLFVIQHTQSREQSAT